MEKFVGLLLLGLFFLAAEVADGATVCYRNPITGLTECMENRQPPPMTYYDRKFVPPMGQYYSPEAEVAPRFFNPLDIVKGGLGLLGSVMKAGANPLDLAKKLLTGGVKAADDVTDVTERGLFDGSSAFDMISAVLPVIGLPPIFGELISSLMHMFEVFKNAMGAIFKKT